MPRISSNPRTIAMAIAANVGLAAFASYHWAIGDWLLASALTYAVIVFAVMDVKLVVDYRRGKRHAPTAQ